MFLKNFDYGVAFPLRKALGFTGSFSRLKFLSVEEGQCLFELKEGLERRKLRAPISACRFLDNLHYLQKNSPLFRRVIEHTSPNPVGQMHIGRLRGTILGDFIANFASQMGDRVEQIVYLNDISKHVAAAILGYREKGTFDTYQTYFLDDNHQKEINEIYTRIASAPDSEMNLIVDHWEKEFRKDLEELIPSKKFSFTRESDFCFTPHFQEYLSKISSSFKDVESDHLGNKYTLSRNRKIYLLVDGFPTYYVKDVYHTQYFHSLNQKLDFYHSIVGKDHQKYLGERRNIPLNPPVDDNSLSFGFVLSEGSKMSSRKKSGKISKNDIYGEFSDLFPQEWMKPYFPLILKIYFLTKDPLEDFEITINPSDLSAIFKFISGLHYLRAEGYITSSSEGRLPFSEGLDASLTLLIAQQMQKFNPACFTTKVLSICNEKIKEMKKVPPSEEDRREVIKTVSYIVTEFFGWPLS